MLISDGQGRRVEIRADQTLDGLAFLISAISSKPPAAIRPSTRPAAGPRRLARIEFGAQVGLGRIFFAAAISSRLGSQNFVEHMRHGKSYASTLSLVSERIQNRHRLPAVNRVRRQCHAVAQGRCLARHQARRRHSATQYRARALRSFVVQRGYAPRSLPRRLLSGPPASRRAGLRLAAMRKVDTRPPSSTATSLTVVVVSSSRPSAPWTTQARSTPKTPSTLATGSTHFPVEHADDLVLGTRRIGQGPQQVENRPHAEEFAPHLGHVAHGGVMGWREHETEPALGNAALDGFGRTIEIDPEGLENVGRARSARKSTCCRAWRRALQPRQRRRQRRSRCCVCLWRRRRSRTYRSRPPAP